MTKSFREGDTVRLVDELPVVRRGGTYTVVALVYPLKAELYYIIRGQAEDFDRVVQGKRLRQVNSEDL